LKYKNEMAVFSLLGLLTFRVMVEEGSYLTTHQIKRA
jgi:hypothetical protein